MNVLGHHLVKGVFGISLTCCYTMTVAADLFISEYIEGSSYNKAIEIYNETGTTVDLSAYELQFFFNGNTSAGRTIALAGSLDSGDVYVISHRNADAALLDQVDQSLGGSWYNGNDAIILLNAGASIDAIGQVGVNPGIGWNNDDVNTNDNTLIRHVSVCEGDSNAYDSFDATASWTSEPIDTFRFIGSHNTQCSGALPPSPSTGSTDLFISEYLEGSGYNKALEIYNNTNATVDLSTYQIQFFFNGNINPARTIVLSGTIAQGDVHVIAHSGAEAAIITHADITSGGTWFNGDDAILLLNGDNIIDAIGAIGVDPGSQWGSGATSTKNNTLIRQDNICEGDNNPHNDFDPSLEWLGQSENTFSFIGSHNINSCNAITPPLENTRVNEVQGDGLSSPMVGQSVTLEAVVIANFQGMSKLNGFYIQEENTHADTDAATSEGIFVNHSTTVVNVGDLVTVTGTVTEHFNRTQLDSATVGIISVNNVLPTAATVTLPLNTLDDLEAFEGMRVSLPQTLTVTDNHNLGRYGEVWLSSGGRLINPTNITQPGALAIAQKAKNNLNRILLDDVSTLANPDTIIYPAPALTATNTLRSGDTTSNIIAIVDYAFDTYRLQPTAIPTFTAANPRLLTPVHVGGALTVASLNVLNYFNGDGSGGGFPTSRGANSFNEFVRQHDKIVAALNAIDADIIGLMEIENDGYGSASAINTLVAGLNALSDSHYAYVNPGVSLVGTDQITVGLIYNTSTVTTAGIAKILDTSVDGQFNDNKNRPTIAQTFTQRGTNAKLTVAVNHLKSKGSSCGSLGDPDTGDGQGNCNQTRTNAAMALIQWLATDPTGNGDTDFLIIGDLNAYAKEDPITAIKSAGYTDLINAYIDVNTAYSYVFAGEAGYLDHALSSPTLTPQVTGTTVWHANSDEPRVLDYNTELKTGDQINALYSADAYRASDHDAVVVGIDLN